MNDAALRSQLDRLQLRAFLVGGVATLLSLVGLVISRAQFFHSYLFAWVFWFGLSLGALVLVMLPALTGGKWGAAIRNLAHAAFLTLPMMALLFLPVLFDLHHIYPWSNGALVALAAHTHKAQWFHPPFFIGRSVFYFAILITLALLVHRNLSSKRLGRLSAGGLIVYVLTMNFASTDWVMSLDLEWHSTIFVVIFMAGQFLSALALMTGLLTRFARHPSLGEMIPTKVFHDLGNLLLAFTVFWTYVSFSQFLIIWSGNLPHEISWYLERSRGGWLWFALVLVAAQFLLPFALLLSREAKRNRERLGRISLAILAASVMADFWLIAPSFHPQGFFLHWLDLTEWLALGGLWFALFFHFLKQRPFFPVEFAEAKADG